MPELVYHTNPLSRGRIGRWMLEEVGQPYEVRLVPFGPSMNTAAYRAINPMGKVPALVHGDAVVTECAAICAYLADAFPEAGLLAAPTDRAAYFRWMFFAAGPLEAATTNRSLGVELSEDRGRMVGYGSYAAVMDTLEQVLTSGPYVAGPAFTAADVYVGAHVAWGLAFGSIENRPAFAAYRDRVTDRDAYRRATALDDAAVAAMQSAG